MYDPTLDTWTPPQWTTSGPSFAFAHADAKYNGDYGLVVQSPTESGMIYAETLQGFGNVYALDLSWNLTDFYGEDNVQPQGLIYLSDVSAGTSERLFFYNDGGTPMVKWYYGGFTSLQSSTYNSWHKLTIVRNGVNSKVVFDGTQYPVTGSLVGSGLIRLGLYKATKEYFDDVRVRKWAGVDPSTTVGEEEVNPLPVELSSFSGSVIGSSVKLSWRTETEVSNYGFEVERSVNIDDWRKIGFVEGHGNTNSPKNYIFVDKNPVGGSRFHYRLKQVDTDGKHEYSNLIEVSIIPNEYSLYQNYPNPFNPSTTIRFSIKEDNWVNISLYSILGEKVATMIDKQLEMGVHEVELNALNLVSGVYFYKLSAGKNGGDYIDLKKMMIIK